MIDTSSIIFLPLLVAFLATVIVTPLSLTIIKRFKILDDPKKHKHPAIIHKKPIPRGGGIPLFAGVLIASLWFLPINSLTIGIFSAAFISLLIGVLDDKMDISPYLRFLVNIASAVIVVASGVSISFITNPLGGILNIPPLVSHLFVGLWVVWVMNMLNWSKGVDGQMPGIVAISAIAIGILSLRFEVLDQVSIMNAKLSFIIAGASLGFLIYNFYPARIFPGYSATSIYLLLSVVSILSSAKLATAILVMGVPMMDGVFTILRRVFTGKSPFWHDKKHLHHLLLGLGFSQRVIALFYWLFSAILGSLALVLSSKGKAFAIIMLIILVGGALMFLHFLTKKNETRL
jgi:UDP-GlcNAc:undecaprenyl-phosphate/decaprenyl-phosphate GlcNAc-1-phosphate transferase